MPKQYDFAGWVTKNDILCSDGVVIKQGAFSNSNGKTVPLVWMHDYNQPSNVLGQIELVQMDKGTYGYGFFNDTEEAQHAKKLVKHGDINQLSIGANKIKKTGKDVVHGEIREVSLVLSGANSGAVIEYVMNHSTNSVSDDEAIIYTDTLIHASDSLPVEKKEEPQNKEDKKMPETKEKTIGEILDTLSPEQEQAVALVIANALDEQEVEQGEETELMHYNAFSESNSIQKDMELKQGEVITAFKEAMDSKSNSLKDTMLQHGIDPDDISVLFPDAKSLYGEPQVYKDNLKASDLIVNAIKKTPFSRIKTVILDLSEENAQTYRAKGYIKGTEKFEDAVGLLHRSTVPATIYKKEKLDRDDLIDVEDFDLAQFMQKIMREMLIDEIARAVLVGDGRLATDPNKIPEANIIPIASDDDLYTIKNNNATTPEGFIDEVTKAKKDYKGSGNPTLYLSPNMATELALIKDVNGHRIYKTDMELASAMRVAGIVETSILTDNQAILVNLADYSIGSSKGGEITSFSDFDIDFNQYKYLLETRMSGALTKPKSAILFTYTPATGQ